MKVSKNWKESLKTASAIYIAILTAAASAWVASPDLQAALPADLVAKCTPFVAVLYFVLRVLTFIDKDAT